MAITQAEIAAELVVPANAQLGEGPVWDPATARLLWVDITAPALHVYVPGTGESRTVAVDRYLGSVWPRAGGGLIAAVPGGFAALDEASGVLTMLREVEPELPGNRMNDAACDPSGRFFAGTMDFDARPDAGSLYRLDPDLSVHTMVTPVTISNGLGWSLDHRLMYYIDTPTRRVDVFDFSPDTGDIADRRPFVHVPPEWGTPDGLTVDTDGYVWVAMHGGGTVRRFAPDGQPQATVTLPVKGVTSCAFGGEGLRELYITTSADLEPAGPDGEPPDVRLAGGLYRAATGATGLATVPFAG